MKRDIYLFFSGFLMGVIMSVYLYRKRKKIIDRLNDIENRVKRVEVKNRIKGIVWETTARIRKLLTNTKGVPLEEKEYILKKVEEKIRKLEELV